MEDVAKAEETKDEAAQAVTEAKAEAEEMVKDKAADAEVPRQYHR